MSRKKAYYAHGRQRRCREDPVSLPSGRLEKTTRSSPHHVAKHHPTGSETTPPYAPRSSRFGSEPPSVEDDVDVWRYAILTCMPETTTTTKKAFCSAINQKPRYSSLRIMKFLNVSHNTWVTSLCLKQMSLIFSCVTRRNLTTLKETFSHYIGENTHSTHLKIICLFVKYSVLTAV